MELKINLFWFTEFWFLSILEVFKRFKLNSSYEKLGIDFENLLHQDKFILQFYFSWTFKSALLNVAVILKMRKLKYREVK